MNRSALTSTLPPTVRGVMATIVLALVSLMCASALAADPAPAQTAWPTGWVVSAAEVAPRLSEATVLDARSEDAWRTGHAPGAALVRWTDFSQTDAPNRGKLLSDDAALQAKLRGLGVSDARPVVVVGDPVGGWGEEGRIVWMLRTLGHERAAMVDGGHAALVKAGVEPTKAAPTPTTGNFTVSRRDAYEVQRDDVTEAVEVGEVVVLDTREPREYAGATPYGERRGGHVPGSKPLYYRELLRPDGTLKSKAAIEAVLKERGVTRGTPVYAYCTGGVRSGWVVTVLQDLGYDARNYAGSMWDWSAAPAATYPLETK